MRFPLAAFSAYRFRQFAPPIVMIVCLGLACFAGDKPGQPNSYDKTVMQQMLKDVAGVVKKNYYDASLKSVDFEAAYRNAQQAIANATNVHQGYEAIENMLVGLNDSQTKFIPPRQPFAVDPGWDMELIGDKVLVTHVKQDSDAAAKGLKAGDQIAMIDGVKPSRESWLILKYELRTLSPRSSLHLVAVSPGEQPRSLVAASKVTPRPAEYELATNDIWRIYDLQQSDWRRSYQPRTIELDNVMVWKLPLLYLSGSDIDSYFRMARKHEALVLDLRGNPNGAHDLLFRMFGGVNYQGYAVGDYELLSLDPGRPLTGAGFALLHMLGMVFDHDVKVADVIERDQTKPMLAKSQSDHAYKGKVVVLIDSESSLAAELFARVVQLEKRGVVVGDRSLGSVRAARMYGFGHSDGIDNYCVYAAEISIADLKMADGKNLDNTGVTPDEVLLPTPEELAAKADPQLARALQLAGSPTSAQKSGMLFPPVKQ